MDDAAGLDGIEEADRHANEAAAESRTLCLSTGHRPRSNLPHAAALTHKRTVEPPTPYPEATPDHNNLTS